MQWEVPIGPGMSERLRIKIDPNGLKASTNMNHVDFIIRGGL